jgi:hypothetical protein
VSHNHKISGLGFDPEIPNTPKTLLLPPKPGEDLNVTEAHQAQYSFPQGLKEGLAKEME